MRPNSAAADAERAGAVWAALSSVLDPELDEPLTDLGFIHAVEVEGGIVTVRLRLPTFWCSANFAYIMGEDILAAVGSLSWVASVTCRLVDHFAERRVNDGLANGLSFREAFQREAEADLADVRAEFRDKSFLGRQAIVIQALRRERVAAAEIVATTVADLEARRGHTGAAHATQIDRYLEARRARPAPKGPFDLAFLTVSGEAVPAEGLLDHLREARRIRGSFEANSEMCRILLAARYGNDPAPDASRPSAADHTNEEHDYERS